MMNFKVALQLFSLRDILNDNLEDTLQKVKDMGYDYVEYCDFGDRPAKEVKSILDKIGLKAFSVHQGHWQYTQDPEGTIQYMKDIGVDYCVLPWFSPDAWRDDWNGTINTITKFAEDVTKAGIKFYYHNHAIEFKKIAGEYIFDKVFRTFPENLVFPQIDVAFFLQVNEDYAKYIRKYAGRVEILHLKDGITKKSEDGTVELTSVPVGLGELDVPSVLGACEDAGTEYIIVEHSPRPGTDPLEEVKLSREYLRKLGL